MKIKIEHVAMYVTNLEQTREFFEKYFDAESSEKYHNKKTGFMSYFLKFAGDSRLEIMTRANVESSQKAEYPTGFHHIALSVGSKEAVDSITHKLHSDGFKLVSKPRTTGDGYYESCIEDTEGNIIEITI